MVQKADRARIKALLTEAITVLCKNGLGYKYSCAVEGLLGITLDDEEVFLVNINENIAGATKRPSPEPEVAKAGTDSPAGGSPSTTPRRRRRRSNSGNMDRASPAKRANYGGGDEQQAGRQQEGSDVIVIKEEVSQEEFSDFYGDTGDGQDDSTNQYAMQQHQAQADQYGAGCSQWDTSQTQSGQSDWPAFTPTQQQQHAISQAASSAMLSPSQVQHEGRYEWENSTPKTTLTSQSAKSILVQTIVEPILERGLKVSAVRLCWFGDDTAQLQPFWENIMSFRDQLDAIMKSTPGVPFFVSCLTATISGKKKKLTFPGVSYWIASDKNVPVRSLFDRMQNNGLGAKMKLILQPYQESIDHIYTAMYTVMKDSVDGVVRRVFDRQTTILGGEIGGPLSITKLYSEAESDRTWLEQAANELRSVRLNVQGMYEWEGPTPKVSLTSAAARNALGQSIVEPTLSRDFKVSAVRLCWFGDDALQLQPYWENILSLREQLDAIMNATPGVVYYVSCLTATMSGKKKKLSFPGVSYWIASKKDTPVRSLFDSMQNNQLGAKMKLLLQPYQEGIDHIYQSMFTVAKDSVEGVVRRVLDRQGHALGKTTPFAITKLFSHNESDRQWLETTAEQLRSVKVTVDVEVQ